MDTIKCCFLLFFFVVATTACGGRGGNHGGNGGPGGNGGNGGPGGFGAPGGDGGPGAPGGNGGHGKRKRAAEELVPAKFQTYDQDRDGKISLEEFVNTVELPDEKAQELFNKADKNVKDGLLRCLEFVTADLPFDDIPSC